ncbi:Scr1 family TA system antitoxin-like transcriptional regulator [Actinophytocola xinjiangensis]|uniref:Scr1 family TA system antitoxin-like transcriptional regulator n=1 Tax=Actinophytocola xinjiangensis TaxID=485602 RepID=UPI000AA837BD|nr:Scr1 family TA system antitoxin-like transcriptional regulator [Actinophytocola xinjiangensis]
MHQFPQQLRDRRSGSGSRCCSSRSAGGEPTILVEVESGALYPDRREDFERYTWMFGRLRDLALAPARSATLISKVVEEL